MADLKSYHVRDAQGNTYGPADAGTLRQWVAEGRIVAGMSIAEEGSPDWRDVATHPALADLFSRQAAAASSAPAPTTGSAPAPNPYAESAAQASPAPGGQVMNFAGNAGQQMNVLALISMISGIIGFPASCCCAFISIPLAIVAIVTGAIALAQFRAEPDRYTGKGMAIAGLACGLCVILLTILLLALGLALNLFKAAPHRF